MNHGAVEIYKSEELKATSGGGCAEPDTCRAYPCRTANFPTMSFRISTLRPLDGHGKGVWWLNRFRVVFDKPEKLKEKDLSNKQPEEFQVSIGSQANVIEIQLGRMLHDIRQEALKVRVSGKAKPPQKYENIELFRKIDEWERQLKYWQSQLSRMEASIPWQRAGFGRGREAAYRDMQSRDGLAHHIDKVQQLAAEVARELMRLIRLCVDPTALDIVEDLSDLEGKAVTLVKDVLNHPATTRETRTAIHDAHITGHPTPSHDIFFTLAQLVVLLRIVVLAGVKHARKHRYES